MFHVKQLTVSWAARGIASWNAPWMAARATASRTPYRERLGLRRIECPAMASHAFASLAFAGAALASLAFASTAGAAVLHVPGDFSTIQGCIDAAIPGDECLVAPGTYNELINFHGKAITLLSSDGPEVTIIDAGPVPEPPEGKPVVRCDTGEGPDTILDGFTLTGGTGSVCGPTTCGGGMYNNGASPTVTNCIFSGNSAEEDGGAMYNANSSPSVSNCTFTENSADVQGGGMYNVGSSSPTVSHCTFNGNTAQQWGGGMVNVAGSHPTVVHSTFIGNSAQIGGGMLNLGGISPMVSHCTFTENSAQLFGGGMLNVEGSNPTVSNCTFTGNSGGAGGGMFNLQSSSPTVTHCTFNGNSAFGSVGGGMCNSSSSDPAVTHCAFSGNSAQSGGGMHNDFLSSPMVTDCTFTENTAIGNDGCGGGMCNVGGASPTVIRCAFEDNFSEVGGGMGNTNSSPTVTDCTLSGNFAIFAGGGMFNEDNASPTVTNCRFMGNTADAEGGGMYNRDNSAPAVTNCTFSGNSAGFDGGGMLNKRNSSPTVHNCTFRGNVGVNGGGGIISVDEFGFNSNTVLSNSVVWGNAPDQIVGASGAVMTVSHSNVQGAWPGVGNINADPMFADADGPDGLPGTTDDDLRLLSGSPCINMGDNAALPADVGDLDGDGDTVEPIPFDLDGHARVLCTVVDMGAYESGIGDDDCDGLVGLGDFSAYFDCLTGPAGGLLLGCEPFDFDGDGDVDLTDLGGFQRAFSGLP